MFNNFLDNFLLLTDIYKESQHEQTPPGTTRSFAYFSSRGGAYATTTLFGLQYFLMRYFAGRVVTRKKIAEAKEIAHYHFRRPDIFNEVGWNHILEKHNGHLPLHIRAVHEGTVVPTGNILFSVENTDDKTEWLTGHAETLLSNVWDPMTVATHSGEFRKIILRGLEQTGTPELIDNMLVDFGARGVSCPEEAAIAGAGHLVQFDATDNIPAIKLVRTFYDEKDPGHSIPAAEHRTVTAWGRHGEAAAVRNMIQKFPGAIIAMPGDSYDIFNMCENVLGRELREEILKRDGVFVVRPDSGDPASTVCRVLGILGERFGYTVNKKDYKVLNPHIRVIQGDGITIQALHAIITSMTLAGWSLDNICFGSGGGLLRKLDRDTQRCKYAGSSVCINGVWHDTWKDPITDPGKRSKAGRLTLISEPDTGGNPSMRTVREGDIPPNGIDLLGTTFLNGRMMRRECMEGVRRLARAMAA